MLGRGNVFTVYGLVIWHLREITTLKLHHPGNRKCLGLQPWHFLSHE